MAERETRRINPIARLTILVLVVLFAFEAFVIFNGVEISAQTIQKYAPWAYEPFLKAVGEHPDFPSRWKTENQPSTEDSGTAVPEPVHLSPSILPASTNLPPIDIDSDEPVG
jgi:hypothetical protein